MDNLEISVVIPAYNEEKRILPVLNNYYFHLKEKFKKNFEIIVVPNNCSDRTFEISKLFSKNKPEIKIINIPYYVGKGGAVMKGFAVAQGRYIGFVDADKSTHPKEFLKLYNNIKGFHGVIASRKIKGAVINPRRKLTQNLSSFLFNFKTRVLFGLRYKDTQCGAKLFKRDVAKFLLKSVTEKSWIFDVNILYLCKKNKIRILECPICWTDDPENSKLSFKEGLKSIADLLKYRMKLFFSKNPQQTSKKVYWNRYC